MKLLENKGSSRVAGGRSYCFIIQALGVALRVASITRAGNFADIQQSKERFAYPRMILILNQGFLWLKATEKVLAHLKTSNFITFEQTIEKLYLTKFKGIENRV